MIHVIYGRFLLLRPPSSGARLSCDLLKVIVLFWSLHYVPASDRLASLCNLAFTFSILMKGERNMIPAEVSEKLPSVCWVGGWAAERDRVSGFAGKLLCAFSSCWVLSLSELLLCGRGSGWDPNVSEKQSLSRSKIHTRELNTELLICRLYLHSSQLIVAREFWTVESLCEVLQ